MFRVSINCVLLTTLGETLRLMPQLFKRFLLNFNWFLYCLLLYQETCYFYIQRREVFLMYDATALGIQWDFTVLRPSLFVGLKLKILCPPVLCPFLTYCGAPTAAPGCVNNVHKVHNTQWQGSLLVETKGTSSHLDAKEGSKMQCVPLVFPGQVCGSSCVWVVGFVFPFAICGSLKYEGST